MSRIFLLFAIGVLVFPTRTSAKISVSAPTKNTIIQRNQNNEGKLFVAGTYTISYDKIEARLVNLALPAATVPSAWIELTRPAGQGIFWGVLAQKGGWYKLEIRGIRAGESTDTTSVYPVGIGEVFLIAGHSNAMGLPDLGAKGGSEQVIAYNALNKYLNRENITVAPDRPMPVPDFERLDATDSIFPSGESAWYWGELGSSLVARLGVPVLFMNAGWAAANSINWRESAEGKNTRNIYVGKNWPNRQPYSNLINTLRYFHSWLGVRSVLWLHGENDAVHLKISQQEYYNNLRKLIEIARQDFGHALVWTIGLSTVSSNSSEPYLPVLNAQRQLAETPNFNAWKGPYTDTIQVPRPEHGHFENLRGGTQGLSLTAQAWSRALSSDFFTQRPAFTPSAFIFTGVVPQASPPGGSFVVPYLVQGTLPDSSRAEAHLLTSEGAFISVVGTGRQSPLRIILPDTLAQGTYRLRVVTQAPTLVGSTSDFFRVQKGLTTYQSIRSLEIREKEGKIEVYALAAPDPDFVSLKIERSDDRRTFRAIGALGVAENNTTSALYSFTDTQLPEQTTYYRLRLEKRTGEIQYSPLVAAFRGTTPPVLIAFPNPASAGERLYLRTDFPEPVTVQLYDLQGRSIPVKVNDEDIVGLSSVPLPAFLAPGLYVLRITRGPEVHTQRILIH